MSVFTNDGTENRMMWDRRETGFMEVWYATLNHPATGSGVWLRYTLTSPTASAPYCELWGFLFDGSGARSFAGKERYDIDRLGVSNGRDDGALVRIADAWLSENHLDGALSANDRSLAWSLDFAPANRCFQHLPEKVRKRVERRVSTVCSPNLSVPFSGTVTVDDHVLSFDGAPGCQSHRWGKKHSLSWAWAHCSVWEEGRDAVFEGVAAQASLGPIPAPKTTFLFLDYDGEEIAFNMLKWALRARGKYELPEWTFTARTDRWKISGVARASKDNMFQVTYSDPDGAKRYCANSEIADLTIEVMARSGSAWRRHGSLVATGTAHLEFGRKERFADIPVAF